MKPFRTVLPFLLLASLFSLVTACSPKSESKAGQHDDHDDVLYTCSMHPQVQQKGPGKCPLCGMTLTPKPKPAATTAAVIVPGETAAPAAGTGAPGDVIVDAARSSVSSIKTEPATARDLTRTIQIFGEIQYISDRHIDYTWYYGGRIEKVLIDFNTTEVSKGQPLFEIYSEAALADQEAYLSALRDRYLSTFYERDVLSAKIEAAADRLRQAGFDDSALKELVTHKKIRRTFIIRAPINGSIVGDIPHVGERFTPETVLLHLTDLSEVWFSAEIFEQDLPALKLGQRVQITSKARPGQAFTGKLVFIDRRIIPEKRTVRARFLIPNPGRELLPQLSATGTLEINLGTAAVTVPASAVIDTGRRKVVYVQTGPDRYQSRDVTTGGEGTSSRDGQIYTSLTSGVKAGENVITGGAFLIDAEAQLQGGASSSTNNDSPSVPVPMPPGHQH